MINFPLNDTIAISLLTSCCTEKTLTFLHPITAIFKESHEADRILAKKEGDAIQDFHAVLDRVLSGKFPLPSTLDNIGYDFNEYLHGRSKPDAIETIQGAEYWVGEKYLPWSTPASVRPALATWIYEQLDGKIGLELTPIYPWEPDEDTAEKDFIPYEEWMKTYKPVFKAEVSRGIALEWLKKTEELIETMMANNEHLDEYNKLCDCNKEE